MSLFLSFTVVVCAVAALSDLRTGLIPNWLTLGALLAGVLGHLVYGTLLIDGRTGLHEAFASLAGLVLCAIAPGILYWKGAMGGGDLKLFAAIGALCQPLIGIEVQMYALVVAAVIAPARLAYEGRLLRVMGGTLSVALNPFLPRARRRALPPEALTSFRLGPAIFAGAALSLVLRSYALLSL
ncbi:MAG TPA: A24 family peptidase [Polyangiaceae bacterium]|nr:A24 family peptidase [Polyangiaceae bacterium]HYQ26273.1 A24 family peptidase [Polyangiaceae bacterium]